MDGIFGNLMNALAEIWKNIGVAQKVSIVLTGIATIGACALVIYFGTRPDWQILFADLDPKQAAKINDIVSGAGVQVKLSDGGKTIMVPSKDVYKMRLKVAGEGLQPNSVTSGGWETFDKLPLGATDLQQQLAKQRALQGELEKMINEMPGVVSSRVMLTIPQKSVFKKDKVRPSASITVNLKQGMSFGAQEVNGVRCLVASSVSGMTPDDVTIVDNRGNLLAKQAGDEGDFATDSNKYMDMQSRTERMLKEKAEAILRPIVGPDNVVAMVTCNMDFNNVDRVTEDYDPERAVPISVKSVKESMAKNSGPSGNGGAPGIKANAPGETVVPINNPTAPVEEKNSSDEKTITEQTYVVKKTVEKVSIKAGKIKSVAVAVTVSKKADGSSWSDSDKKSFQDLVESAVGKALYQTDIAGGEQAASNVTVKEMDFFKEKKVESTPGVMENIGYNMETITNSPVVRPLLGIILLAGLFLVFKKYFAKGAEGVEAMGGSSVYSEEVKQLPADVGAEKNKELGTIMDALQAKASASPQTVANLMENWLAQDQG